MEQVGPYRVLEELGRGGMGAVFKALAPDGRTVAVKVLLQGQGASPTQRTRFEREARALTKVNHRNVVRLLDLGSHRGTPYLVLAYHEQGTLADALKRTTLSGTMAARLGRQVAAGLAAAHARGVLHRDVKPDNVLFGSEGRALLTDFGLAKDRERADETQRLTKSGIFLGTPGYWAPEQAAGKLHLLGPATDVYGLGATLYAALTGRPPFVGESLVEVLTATTEETPPPIRSFRRDLPPGLEAIVSRCLEKDPNDRWPSAGALEQALGAVLAPPPPPALRRATRVIGLGAAASIVLGGLVAAFVVESTGREPTGGRPSSPLASSSPSAADCSPATPVPLPSAPRAVASPSPSSPPAASRRRLLEQAKAAYEGGREREGADLLRRAAEAGEPEAMFSFGQALLQGRGVSKDVAQAALWFRRGADAGQVQAMFNLAALVESGRGVPRDPGQATAWYLRAAERGHTGAMNNLAVRLDEGQGVARDPVQAALWYRRAAEGGVPASMTRLGVLLEHGIGVSRDWGQAALWYRRGAEAGDPVGMRTLGVLLLSGKGVVKDAAQGTSWLLRAAELGDAPAMTCLGTLANRAGNAAQAAGWYRRAAQGDDRGGMYNFGYALYVGHGVPRDPAQGVTWFRRAADLGDPAAMFNLAKALVTGTGVAQDEVEAALWFRRAAASDEPAVRASAQQELKLLGR